MSGYCYCFISEKTNFAHHTSSNYLHSDINTYIMRTRLLIILAVICTTATAQKRSVSVLGDSYSTYEHYTTPATNEQWYFEPWRDKRTDVSDVTQTWWYQLCRNRDFKLDTNNSYSGSTICFTGYNGDDYTQRSFITRAGSLGCPDIILVFGGTNDSWANSPLGELKFEGITREELFNYRQAVCYLGKYLTTRYPNTDIYFILNDQLKPEIGDAMRQVCAKYRLHLIELHDISKTSGHPDIAGMRQIAEQVGKAIK